MNPESMKITQTYYKDGKFWFSEKWPVKPFYPDYAPKWGEWNLAVDDYNKALTLALSEAVPFEDQDEVKCLAFDFHVANVDGHTSFHFFETFLKDGLYEIAPIEVKVVVTACYHVEKFCSCKLGDKCKTPLKRARIVPSPLIEGESHKKEKILCAAIWYDDKKQRPHLPVNITTGVVVCGYRHPNCLISLGVLYKLEENIQELSIESDRVEILRNSKQGFLTDRNRFVDRKEGLSIAILSGQIEKAKYGNQLYSEDLY